VVFRQYSLPVHRRHDSRSETLGEFARLPGSSPGAPAEYQSRSLGASKDLRHGLEAIREGRRDAAVGRGTRGL
jgi:hypothetical protein